MKKQINEISVVRKRVVNNIPGFDDETNTPQNQWFKLYDFTCVDIQNGQTARIYQYEHAEGYQNNEDTFYMDFTFESVRQSFQPPYDIKTGDYVAYYQGGERHLYRIVKPMITQVFPNCCAVELMCNDTHPRETEMDLACGASKVVPDDDPMFTTKGVANG